MKVQYVRTPFLSGWDQVPLERLTHQSKLKNGLQLEGHGNRKVMALTFDDGPSRYTLEILRILEKHKVKASFFMLGRRLQRHLSIAQWVSRRGHLIANHTYNHPYASGCSVFNLKYLQLQKTDKILKKHLKISSSIYRPAYGDINDNQLKQVKRFGYKSVGWSIDTHDWYHVDKPEKISQQAIEHFHNEAIILMHDGEHNRRSTVEALENIIVEAKRQKYQLVTLNNLLASKEKNKKWCRREI